MALSQYGVQSWRQARGTENPGWERPVPAPRPQGRILGRAAAAAPRWLGGRVAALKLCLQGLHPQIPRHLGVLVPEIAHACPRADRRQGEWQDGTGIEA